MTAPQEHVPGQTEFLPPVDQELLNTEASLILRDYFQPDVDGIAAEIRQMPEPTYGYWEPSVREYANSDTAPNIDRFEYEDEARTKAPEERNAFDKFVLGVSSNPPEDVSAPEGSHLTPYGYYKDTGKRLVAALEEGRVPEGFEDPALLAKATDFLLARGVNQLFAQPSRANEDLQAALTLYRKATEHIPGFDYEQAGSGMLIRTGIACRAILMAESPHFAQGSAGRQQAAEMLWVASEAIALDNIHRGITLTKRYERQAAYEQELAERELQQPQDKPTQQGAEAAWPTEEQDVDDDPSLYPKPLTSLKTIAPEQTTHDDSIEISSMDSDSPQPEATYPTSDEAREQVTAALEGEDSKDDLNDEDEPYIGPGAVFDHTDGTVWDRPDYNTVIDAEDPGLRNAHDYSAWLPPVTEPTAHKLVPIDVRVEQRLSTGVAEQFEPEPKIGDSRLDSLLTGAGNGLKRWSRANATQNPDARLRNKVGKLFGAIGDAFKGKGESSSPMTTTELDARDQTEYARINDLLEGGHNVTYDANGNVVVDAEPRRRRPPTRAERRRARQAQREQAEAERAQQANQPQTAAQSKVEEVRQQLEAANARRNRINDHLKHGEHDMVAQEVRNMPTRELLGLPAEIVANLGTNARELWEVRFVKEAKAPYPPPYPQILRTEAGRQAYRERYPERKYSW